MEKAGGSLTQIAPMEYQEHILSNELAPTGSSVGPAPPPALPPALTGARLEGGWNRINYKLQITNVKLKFQI